MKLLGKKLILKANGRAIAASTSFTLDIDTATIETASPTDGRFRSFIAGRSSWSVTCGWLCTSKADLLQKVRSAGSTVELNINYVGSDDDSLTGAAIVTKCKITANKDNLVQGSFTFKGIGPLS